MMSPPSDAEQTRPRRPGLTRVAPTEAGAGTAGYSGRPLAAKLGIKGGQRFAVVAAPGSFAATLGPLSPHVEACAPEDGAIDLVVLFTRERGDLAARFPALRDATATAGSLWIAWPKRASGVSTDLTESVVREIGLDAGMVDTKVCAIDATWSALRFVRRLVDRPTPPARPRRSTMP